MCFSGLIVIILRLDSCLVVFIKLILVVKVEFVCLVNSSVVIIGFNLCSNDNVIIWFRLVFVL